MLSRKANMLKRRRRGREDARRRRDNARMDIQLNGEPRTLPPGATLTDLLHGEGLAQRRVAAEINGEIVPRGAHATRVLADGDKVEVVHALGGG